MSECDNCGALNSGASLLQIFIVQCGEMEEKNWCPSQVEMLSRLFGAVLHGVEYADYEPGSEE